MVKIYLIDEKTGKRSKGYTNVSFWSIFKAYILGAITLYAFLLAIAFLIAIII